MENYVTFYEHVHKKMNRRLNERERIFIKWLHTKHLVEQNQKAKTVNSKSV